jgi:flagellin-like protein
LNVRFYKKRGVAELFSTLIVIGVTLVAGVALIGFVNGELANSSNSIGNSIGANINFLNEKEVIAFVNFGSSTSATVWVYDNGKIDLSLASILIIGDVVCSGVCGPAPPNYASTCGSVLNCISATISFAPTGVTVTNSVSGDTICVLTPPGASENPLVNTAVKQGANPTGFIMTLPAGSCASFTLSFVSSSTSGVTQAYTIAVTGQYGSTASAVKTTK